MSWGLVAYNADGTKILDSSKKYYYWKATASLSFDAGVNEYGPLFSYPDENQPEVFIAPLDFLNVRRRVFWDGSAWVARIQTFAPAAGTLYHQTYSKSVFTTSTWGLQFFDSSGDLSLDLGLEILRFVGATSGELSFGETATWYFPSAVTSYYPPIVECTYYFRDFVEDGQHKPIGTMYRVLGTNNDWTGVQITLDSLLGDEITNPPSDLEGRYYVLAFKGGT